MCDDQGGLVEGVVEDLYTGFVCEAQPQVDFLLSPYGSALTRRAQHAVSIAEHAPNQPCYKPVLDCGGERQMGGKAGADKHRDLDLRHHAHAPRPTG